MIKVLAGAVGLAAAGLTWGVTEAHLFTLRRVTAPVLPAGQDPVRVLHISDIHLLPSQRRKLDWIAGLAELKPDLVVNTGDNISSNAAIEPLLEAWGPLLDVPGVFVFGSNDYKKPQFKSPLRYLGISLSNFTPEEGPHTDLDWRRLRQAMLDRGWRDLTHQRVELDVAGRRFAFRGTDDAHLERDDYAKVAGPAVELVDLNIGVTHAPYLRLLDVMTADGMDLIMAGHTHGGQVCTPWGALITNCDLDTERVKGLHSHSSAGRRAALHVSAGIGASPFAPYRVFCRPEATLLTLVARDA